MIHATINHPDPGALIGLVLVRGLLIGPSPSALSGELDTLVSQRSQADFPPPAVKDGVRALLRAGGFKPAGRNKPASEYLAQAAREGRFPRISNAVDCNNLVSLESGLPVSILDARAFATAHGQTGDPEVMVHLRPGRPGESYVFNQGGQEIDLAGLLCACALQPDAPDGLPLGNAVKDSMAGKLKDESTGALGVIYGNAASVSPRDMAVLAGRFAELLVRHCGGQAETLGLGA